MVTVIQIVSGGPSPRRRTVLFDTQDIPIVTAKSVINLLGIDVGFTAVSADALRSLVAETEPPLALERGIDMVSRRELSSSMLSSRLAADGFSVDTAREVASRLADLGAIDDRRYARLVWRTELNAGKGTARAAFKLRQAGIPDELAQSALEECRTLEEVPDQLGVATALAVRWGAPFSARKDRESAIRKLVSRGFPIDVALRACAGSDLDAE